MATTLAVFTVVALIFTAQTAVTYVGWSNAAYHTTVTVTNLSWQTNPTNTTVTINIEFTVVNPSDSRMALYSAYYRLYLNGQLISGSGSSVVSPPKSVYRGQDLTFTSGITIQNSSEPLKVSYILAQTSYVWFISGGSANFHTEYADMSVSFAQSYI